MKVGDKIYLSDVDGYKKTITKTNWQGADVELARFHVMRGDVLTVTNINDDYINAEIDGTIRGVAISNDKIKFFSKKENEMLKIEDLKVGDELVCIDLKSMEKAWENASDLWRKAKIDVLKISHINVEGGLVRFQDGKFYLERHELKYFKKKEQSQYTFDDLIDVAVQANKDRVINGFSVVSGVLNCQTLDGEDYNLGIGCEVDHGIEYLQSLYKETFVIESEEDFEKIRIKAKGTLLNGNKFTVEGKTHSSVYGGLLEVHADFTNRKDRLSFLSVKGATVEQSR